jgi:type I restriction enzyme S subunit
MSSDELEIDAATTYPRGFSTRTAWKWPLIPAQKLVSLNYGRALRADNRKPGNVPVYGTNGQCGWHDTPLAKGPGLILGRKGQGPLGVEWCETDFWVIDTAYYVNTLTSDVDLKYIYQLVKYVGLNHLKDGTSNPTLSRNVFGAQLFPLPSLVEQKSITEVLAALDDRITLLRETNATLEAIAQALFKSWFVDFDPVRAKMEGRAPAGIDEATAALFPDGFEESELGLGLVPKGWTATTLAALTKQHGGSIQTGPFGSQLHASDYVPDGIPVVMPKDIANRRVATDSVARIDAINVERLARHKLQVGDIVFSRRGDVEKHALIGDREVGWLCGTGCLLVRPGKNWIAPNFLSMALDAPAARLWLVQHAVGATMPNLNTGILGSVRLVLPPSVLLAAFENVIAASQALQSQNASTIETLATLRDTLLPRLISGQLRLPQVESMLENV